MTPLPPELEALMPEPFGYVPFAGEFYPPDELDAEVKNDPSVPAVFTADQVRQAMLDATERAAKKVPTNWCDSMLTGPDKVPGIDKADARTIETLLRRIAAAIRGDGGQG